MTNGVRYVLLFILVLALVVAGCNPAQIEVAPLDFEEEIRSGDLIGATEAMDQHEGMRSIWDEGEGETAHSSGDDLSLQDLITPASEHNSPAPVPSESDNVLNNDGSLDKEIEETINANESELEVTSPTASKEDGFERAVKLVLDKYLGFVKPNSDNSSLAFNDEGAVFTIEEHGSNDAEFARYKELVDEGVADPAVKAEYPDIKHVSSELVHLYGSGKGAAYKTITVFGR